MVPAISRPGRSFRGAALYFLHDKSEPGQARSATSDRVAWTFTLNLPTDDPHDAWRIMAFTAKNQHALKQQAGIKATGRKLERPVFAFSLAWHPDETPTREEMIEAARASLRALGLADHQVLITAHDDEPHPHVHILVNRIDPRTGCAARLSKSKLILSAWAQVYEESRGRVFCKERVENNARRQGTRPGRAADNRSRRQIRPEYDTGATEHRQDHAERYSAQAGLERQGERRRHDETGQAHRQRRQERAAIGDRYRAATHGDPIEAARITALLAQGEFKAVLDELTRHRSTFTRAQLVRMIGRHTPDENSFRSALQTIESGPDLIPLGGGGKGALRFTTRSQLDLEQRMARHASALSRRLDKTPVIPRWGGKSLSTDQNKALLHILAAPGLSAVVGYAGTGKSTMLAAAKASWEAAGYRVQGAALSSIAADGLSAGAGIDSRTVHSRLFQWECGQNRLTARDVLVVDEAGMIGSRQMERLLAFAVAANAKVVLAGDYEQLQAIEAGGAFKAIVDQIGAARIDTVRRQKQGWQRAATVELATGKTGAALARYEAAGMVHQHGTEADAKSAVIAAWHRHRTVHPGHSQIVLAYTRRDVRDLTDMARARLREDGSIGPDVILQTGQGPRAFAEADRIYFLRNDTRLGVSNGSLGTIERIDRQSVTVRLDGKDERRVTFRLDQYAAIDHGYAATIHKSQGVTVDRAHLLAGRNLDRHAAYVAMTRHRDRLDLHWSREAFSTRYELERVLSRKALKGTTLDYAAADRAASHQAADDARVRIERRAANFEQREATQRGRMANARSLAGANASFGDVARLALSSRGRALLFQSQQRALRRWSRTLAMRVHLSRPDRPVPHMDRADALKAHAALFAPQIIAMHGRHDAEREAESSARRELQGLAARNWAAERERITREQPAARGIDRDPKVIPFRPDVPKPRPR